ncbi:MAG TPA: YdiU family protein [Steroidobacteraceae bacterium]|nr:YdiU family protein [Steroidobacteraceae bacterium]
MNRSDYVDLPERFFARVKPVPVETPRLLEFNRTLAAELGLDDATLGADELAGIYSGNVIPPGLEPIAMAYAGHQFGHFVPQLGDGRAILLGEARNRAGARRDIQLKGSGRTPYSRSGDGRAALGPVLREYLVSEAMHALGIPATRALAAVSTGETVFRERALPGAILTRVAASFVRVGTFQFFAARGDTEGVRQLADYVIDRHYPHAKSERQPYLALLRAVTETQASLIASWMHVGFIHGVMNTDNMALSGETIDFGPCAFLDSYDPAAVFSSIDEQGRYAYGNQPHAAIWNLARFAETLLPIIDASADRAVELASEVLAAFSIRFSDLSLAGVRRKLGLSGAEDGDAALAGDLLGAMHRNQADFTLTFRRLCDAAEGEAADVRVRSLFVNPRDYDDWASRWRARLAREPLEPEARAAAMRRVNPAFIPRNHRIQQVIDAAVEREDFSPFAKLSTALSQPYQPLEGFESYADPPEPGERVLQTFCGT